MRKTLAFLLTILLCLTGAFYLAEEAGEVEQETFTCEEYEYALLDDGTAEITKYHGEAETLEVPDELDGYCSSCSPPFSHGLRRISLFYSSCIPYFHFFFKWNSL